MRDPWYQMFIKLQLSNLQQYREYQLAFYRENIKLISWRTIVTKIASKSLTYLDFKFYFFGQLQTPFYKVGMEILLIQTNLVSDSLSFYKAPPGHLISTKTVQTWFLRDSPGMFLSVCAGKTYNYQKNLFILQRFAK